MMPEWIPIDDFIAEKIKNDKLHRLYADAARKSHTSSILHVHKLKDQVDERIKKFGTLDRYPLFYIEYRDVEGGGYNMEIIQLTARIDSGQTFVTLDPYESFLAYRTVHFLDRELTELEEALLRNEVLSWEIKAGDEPPEPAKISLWFNNQRHTINFDKPDLEPLNLKDPSTEAWRLEPLIKIIEKWKS